MSQGPGTPTLRWADGAIEIIDQTLLPGELVILRIDTVTAAVDAISRLAIRGAPALGVFGAYSLVIGLDETTGTRAVRTVEEATDELERLRQIVGNARPTAVNLRWAVDRTIATALAASPSSVDDLREGLLREAHAIAADDEAACAAIGRAGAGLLPDNPVVATHCNTGRLATAGIGTALAPVYSLAAEGLPVKVLAAETRPLLQGARLTAWELTDAGVDVTVVADGAMASLVVAGEVDAVMVGADRIAANGDTANKIGTLSHALAAQAAGVPFYVLAPSSTVDLATSSGETIPIELRDDAELHQLHGSRRLTPEGAAGRNPAFDVTPHRLITAIVTERGVHHPPYIESLRAAIGTS